MADSPDVASYLMLPEFSEEPFFIKQAKFFEEDKVMNVGQGYIFEGQKKDSTLDVRSDILKLIIPTSNSFYYMIHNVIGEILYYHHHLKDKIQIIYAVQRMNVPYNHPKNIFAPFHDYIFKLMDFHKINYIVYDQSINDGLLINKFYQARNSYVTSFDSLIYNYTDEMRQSKYLDKVKPFRKVYLSRKHFWKRPVPLEDEYYNNKPYADHDDRIDDHDKLEKFFEEMGFDIINPESFPSMEDQVQYFSEVKCVASLTSSGLVNGIFMQPGQSMIELTTPLLHFMGTHWEEQLHYFHAMTAFAKYHKYTAITNLTRSADLIEQQIRSDKTLYEYIKNV